MTTTMEQKKEERKDVSAPKDAAVLPEHRPQKEAAPVLKPEMSKGEKWYNWIVYKGINYWANLGISLAVTDFFLHGKGNGFYKKGLEKFTKGLTAAGMKRPMAKWIGGMGLGRVDIHLSHK